MSVTLSVGARLERLDSGLSSSCRPARRQQRCTQTACTRSAEHKDSVACSDLHMGIDKSVHIDNALLLCK